MGAPLEITADEAIFGDAQFQSGGTGVFHRSDAVFLYGAKHAEHVANSQLAFALIDGVAENTDLRSGPLGAPQQLSRTERHFLGVIFLLNAIPTGSLAEMLAQKFVGMGVQDPHLRFVPLHVDRPADPTRWRAVIGGGNLDAAVQVNDTLPVLVVTERFERQRKQEWFFFREHGRDLSFGRAMNARISPTLFPAIQIRLRFLQALEALPF